jgi:hypothetical protein
VNGIGSALLHEVDEFLSMMLPVTEEQRTVILGGAVLSHSRQDPEDFTFSTLPRFAVTGPKRTGKTSILDAALMLSEGGWMSDATSAGVRAFFNTPQIHTMFLAEASKVFGETGLGGQQHPVYRILADGYRRTATLSFSVNRAKVDVSSFGVAWCDGIGEAVPSDILDRSVRIRTRTAPREVTRLLLDTLDEDVTATGHAYAESIHEWMNSEGMHEAMHRYARTAVPALHPALSGRTRQVWGPLFTVFAEEFAGPEFSQRIMAAFLKLGIDEADRPKPTPGQLYLLDTAEIIRMAGNPPVLYTADLIGALNRMPDRNYHRKTYQYIIQETARFLGPARNIRGENLSGVYGQGKGRDTGPLLDRADEVMRMLYPEPDAPDEAEDECAFSPLPVAAPAPSAPHRDEGYEEGRGYPRTARRAILPA